MLGVGYWQADRLLMALALIWLAHIGLDRLLGTGLKYNDRFTHTHLGDRPDAPPGDGVSWRHACCVIRVDSQGARHQPRQEPRAPGG